MSLNVYKCVNHLYRHWSMGSQSSSPPSGESLTFRNSYDVKHRLLKSRDFGIRNTGSKTNYSKLDEAPSTNTPQLHKSCACFTVFVELMYL